MLPPCFDLRPPPSNFEEPPHVCNTFGKPCFWWWRGQSGSYKGTSFISFLKIQVHLFFGCFGICIYCIDSVTNVTFYLKSGSHLLKKLCYFLHWKPFKANGKCFLYFLILSFIFSFWRYFSFCHDFLVMQGKWLD